MEVRDNRFFLIGVLAYFPIALPDDPIYVTPIVCTLYLLLTRSFKSGYQLFLPILFIFLCITTALNLLNKDVQWMWFVSLLSTFCVVLISTVRNLDLKSEHILDGFSFAGLIMAVFVVFLLLVTKNYQMYLDFSFFKSENRLWARDYVYGWPNVYCALQSVAAFWLRAKGNTKLSWFIIFTNLLTASRVGMLSFFLLAVLDPCSNKKLKTLIRIAVGLLILSIITISLNDAFVSFLTDRVFKYSDRLSILYVLINAFLERPLGYGNVPFDHIDNGLYYVSFHSSFLKILIRYGVAGLLLFFLLITPNLKKLLHHKLLYLYLFILFMGIPQDFLLQLNIYFILMVIVNNIEQTAVKK